MKAKRSIVEIFGRCSRLLNKIALNTGDSFFSRLCFDESDKLLSEFIFFLKGGESASLKSEVNVAQTGILQHRNVVKSDDIVQHEHRVAQYRLQLISRIKNTLNLLDILKHLGLARLSTSLLLEKNLLLLKLSVLNIYRPTIQSPGKEEAGKPRIQETKRTSSRLLPELGQIHQEILGFIKSKERAQNLEIFSRFGQISRRTLKKKLSDLVRTTSIRRIASGKKVFYSAGEEKKENHNQVPTAVEKR